MRIEIFVVTTEISRNIAANAYWTELEAIQADLVREFGGLTETGTERGYWNDNGEICADTVKRWIIYAHHTESIAKIEAYAQRIKKITQQEKQAFGIDGKMVLI
jgi:hypothetical protein